MGTIRFHSKADLKFYNDSVLHRVRSEYTEAERDLKRGLQNALRKKIKYVGEFYCEQLGELYYEMNQKVKALEMFDKAEKISPGSSFPLIARAEFYTRVSQKHREAIHSCKKALKLIPTSKVTDEWGGLTKVDLIRLCYALLGINYFQLGMNRQALRQLDKINNLTPTLEHGGTVLELIELLIKRNQRSSQAKAYLNTSLGRAKPVLESVKKIKNLLSKLSK